MDTGKIRLVTVITALAAIVLVETLARVPVAAGRCSPQVALLAVRMTEILLLLLLIWLWQRDPGSVGLGKNNIAAGIKAGLNWSIVFGGAVAVVGALLLAAGVNPAAFFRLNLPPGTEGTIYLFTGVVVSPLAEELFFRGVLYGFFRRWGVAAGVIVTTVIFAGLHLSVATIPIAQAVGGILFCLAYEKEKSLMAPYVVHAMGNGAIFSLGLLSIWGF